MKKIFITGINGTIGRILAQAFSPDYEPFGLDSNGPYSEHIVQGNIADFDQTVNAITARMPIDCIIHLAAASRHDSAWEYVLPGNIIGTRNIYECARQLGIPRIIFASTSHVVGRAIDELLAGDRTEPIRTDEAVRPDSDYGTSKVFGEAIAREYYDLYGIQSIILRIGSVLPDDNPVKERDQRLWLSHKDVAELFRVSIESPINFGIFNASSANDKNIFDISETIQVLGFKPSDGIRKPR